MEKKELRRVVKERFKALGEDEKLRKSALLIERLGEILAQRKASVVALFSPMNDEVQIIPLVEKQAQSGVCRVVLPRVESMADGEAEMEFYDYEPTQMAVGAFGIIEPQAGEPCEASEIDVMVVPGVAFDSNGGRLGRGKGYYDRYISRVGFRAECIGVCFDFQLFDKLPTEPHDRAMDMVVSNNSKL
ncbi:MAG: 5-formyltetrahydrofolate cyclo-ligase [Alistipes sp.]|nr:5-formyltetrahydrofolate cyclo-ligase [Alistipes sp.]